MMTPEEIQQVVEDYRKSNSLNEIFNDKTKNFLRNFGRQNKDKVNGNGAQGSTNGAQGAQSSTTTGAQGGQGAQTNTIKKNEIDQFIRKGKEVNINDFGGIKPTISPATFSTNQKQSRELVKSGELKDTDLNKYSRSNTYTADDGKTQVTRSTVNTIAQSVSYTHLTLPTILRV